MADYQRLVWYENRDYLLETVPWHQPLFLQALLNAGVLSKLDLEDLRGKPENMVPYRLVEILCDKGMQTFQRFCDVLKTEGCEVVSTRLQCAMRAKSALDSDIKKEAEIVKEHLRGSTVSHPSQEELYVRVAEKIQIERGCWQERLDKMQSRLEDLQKKLYDVCKMLHTAVNKSRSGSDASDSSTPGGDPLIQIHSYTNAFVQIIKDLKTENEELRVESSNLREENTEVQRRIKQLEKMKRKQQEELKKARSELDLCRKCLSDLEDEMRQKDKEKTIEISHLREELEKRSAEIELLMEEKDNLLVEVQNLTSKMTNLEENQDQHKQENEQKMSFLQNQLASAQTDLQRQIQELALSMGRANAPANAPRLRYSTHESSRWSGHECHAKEGSGQRMNKRLTQSYDSTKLVPNLANDATGRTLSLTSGSLRSNSVMGKMGTTPSRASSRASGAVNLPSLSKETNRPVSRKSTTVRKKSPKPK